MRNRRIYETTLYLATIEHFFRQPDISPFSDDYQEYSYTSGIEYLANELYAAVPVKEIRVHLVLPVIQMEPDLEQRTRQAVQRYCHARMKEIGQELHGLRQRALHALLMALVGLVIFISLGDQLSVNPSWLLQILGQGLIVIGWVYLWFPLDSIIFGVRHSHLDKKIYEQLIHMHLTIEYRK
jgi:hypothetical protein